ncbi:hypothetical protein [Promicromonospora sp. NPDC019610]|uniref:hypothetical protein n=1 Tax=Promicromonospora sp. NPDC019610 TaxID=3364405 RepID=UPI00379A48DF
MRPGIEHRLAERTVPVDADDRAEATTHARRLDRADVALRDLVADRVHGTGVLVTSSA